MASSMTTTGTRHETTKAVRASLRENGWTNVARVTIDTAAGVLTSPKIAISEFRKALTIADAQNSGRLVVQEDRHVTTYDGPDDPDLHSRTFYVFGYQPEPQPEF